MSFSSSSFIQWPVVGVVVIARFVLFSQAIYFAHGRSKTGAGKCVFVCVTRLHYNIINRSYDSFCRIYFTLLAIFTFTPVQLSLTPLLSISLRVFSFR